MIKSWQRAVQTCEEIKTTNKKKYIIIPSSSPLPQIMATIHSAKWELKKTKTKMYKLTQMYKKQTKKKNYFKQTSKCLLAVQTGERSLHVWPMCDMAERVQTHNATATNQSCNVVHWCPTNHTMLRV